MTTPRPALIADTAIALIAERGLRGLTHRAVDEAAGLPAGTTSNHARTRAALLEAALTRIADLETAEIRRLPDGPPGEVLVETVALGVHAAVTVGLPLTVARLELAIESARRPELRAVYDRLADGFRSMAVVLLARAGSRDPERHGRSLLRWCDGVIFHCAVGAGRGRIPAVDELRAEAAAYLGALLATG